MLKVAFIASALILGATGLATASTNQTTAAGSNPREPFQTSASDSSSTPVYPFSSVTESCSYLRLNHNTANTDGQHHYVCRRG
jgi:hypothetical protein